MNGPLNGHVFDSPDEFVNGLAASMELARVATEYCPHCRAIAELLPGAGSRWLVGIRHAEGCPEFTD